MSKYFVFLLQAYILGGIYMCAFDFNLLWVSKCSYPAKHAVKEHNHDYYQFIFITSGQGTIFINGLSYEAQMNQLYILKPNVRHGIEAHRTKSLHTIEIKFYCGNMDTNSFIDKLPYYTKNAGSRIGNCFVSMEEEVKEQDNYIEDIIELLLIEVLYHLARLSNKDDNQLLRDNQKLCLQVNENDKKPLSDAIEYMRKNYHREISLDDLAGLVNLSTVYFCSIFKDQYGVSPMQYLQDIRLHNAKWLLANTNDSITSIAEQVGFQSIHYFSRFFKSNEEITPTYFRQVNQGFIFKEFQEGMNQC